MINRTYPKRNALRKRTYVLFVISYCIGLFIGYAVFGEDPKPEPGFAFDGALDNGIMRDGNYLVWVENGKQVLRVKCEEAAYDDDGKLILWWAEDDPCKDSWALVECETSGKLILIDQYRNKNLCVIDGRFAEEGEWDMKTEDLCDSLKPSLGIDDDFWHIPEYINNDPWYMPPGAGVNNAQIFWYESEEGVDIVIEGERFLHLSEEED